jgi:hypothetical protein
VKRVVRRTYTGPRPWEQPTAAPFSEVADCTRGELRLAAEVALAELHAIHVPTFAHERAVATLKAVAS